MLQALKVLVIVMAVIIAVGLAVLGYGIYQKAKELDLGSKKSTSQGGMIEKSLAIPPGCKIDEMRPDGARLYIRLGSAKEQDSQCAVILIVDTATGKTIGTLKTSP